MRVPITVRIMHDERGGVRPLAYHFGDGCWVEVEGVMRITNMGATKLAEDSLRFVVHADHRAQTLFMDAKTGIWTLEMPDGAYVPSGDDESC